MSTHKKYNIVKHNKTHNKTKKSKSNEDTECLNVNRFTSFEKEYEKSFKGNFMKEDKNIETKLIQLFKKPFSPVKYTAQDDYYTWINYEWIASEVKKSKKEKKYYSQIDSFRIVQEKVYYELIDIVKEYIKNNNTSRSRALEKVYKSFTNLDEHSAEKHIVEAVNKIDTLIAEGNLIKLLVDFNKNEVISWGSPIVWTLLPDEKNVSVYRNTISSPQLSLYDYTIYIDDPSDPKETQAFKHLFKRKYLEFLNIMFDACLGKNHGLKAQDVFDAEYDILTSLGCDSIKKDSPDLYNVVTTEQSMKELGFDWGEFSKEIGYKKTPEKLIVDSLNYVKCIMDLLKKDWQTPKWRTYFIYINIRQIMRFHKKWRYLYYEFHGKFVEGQLVPGPPEIYAIFGISFCFNTLLTNEYVRKNPRRAEIDYTKNLGSDLLTVFKRIIKRNTWLSPKTKKYALLKLEHIKLIVGSPAVLREDPLLDYKEDDAWGNILKLTRWKRYKQIHLEGKETIDIPIIDWKQFKFVGTQAYVVNAYYTPTLNSIYVPLAYLQKPFIDLEERGIEYNLAFVGYTLGHEMSHSLDDMGSKYDHKGNLVDWWTPEDRKKFNAKVKNVIEQYETFASYDGIKMDASLSTGENLADISGLAICEEYLRDFQEKNQDIVPIRSLSFNAFFTYVAIQGRQQIYKEAIKSQLKINPHPMNKYRTNCPLSRLELFRSIYNIQKTDKMFWNSTDTIW